MPASVKLAPADPDAFTADWIAGVGIETMARKYGHSPSWVSVAAKRLGLPSRRGTNAVALAGGVWVNRGDGVQVYRTTMRGNAA